MTQRGAVPFESRAQNIVLRGDYEGTSDSGVTLRFRFCDDSVYYYAVEQVGRWRMAQRGRFLIKPATIPQHGTKLSIEFVPLVIDVKPTGTLAYAMLAERKLLGSEREAYFLEKREQKHVLNPNLVVESYSFYLPDSKGTGYFGLSWQLQPAGD